MDPSPRVSILINNYNYGKFLGDAISSALNQTYPNVEVVVVDDGSTDNSREVIQSYGDRIVPVFKDNGGQASALNAGFAASKGEVICLLDADDAFLPEKVSKVLSLFQSNPGSDWVFTESAPIWQHNVLGTEVKDFLKDAANSCSKIPYKQIDFRSELKDGKLPDFTPSTSNLCFYRKFLEKILPMPETKGVSGIAMCDTYLNLLTVGLGTGCVTPANLGVFRLHSSNRFTAQESHRRDKVYAEILIVTSYWISNKFPEFNKLSKKLFAKGFAIYLKSKDSNKVLEKMVKLHLSSMRLSDKFEIGFGISYYFVKLLLGK